MAIMKIYTYGSEILTKKATRINFNLIEKKLPKIINDMTQTCLFANGVGLAAPQVGLDLSLAIIMYPVKEDKQGVIQYQRYVVINPEISTKKGTCDSDEGCLSLPGITAQIERAQEIKVKCLNEKGLPIEIKATGRLAIILQHEIDHLYGKVFIDHLPASKRMEVVEEMKNARRKNESVEKK